MKDLVYEQPDMEELLKKYDFLLDNLNNAVSIADALNDIEQINEVREYFFSMYWLSYINYLLDVKSEYWNEQETFFAKYDPIINQYRIKYFKALHESKFKEEIKKQIGDKVFRLAELDIQLLSDDINEEKQREKELSNAFSKIAASAKVNFDDKELTLAGLAKYQLSANREIRKSATEVKNDFLLIKEKEFDEIIDELVIIRNKIANKLGFKSYTDVGYIEMHRLDYGKEDVKIFRDEIIKYIVPLVQKLKKEQGSRLGLDELKYYDEGILFPDGNAQALGDVKWVKETALKMYQDITPAIYSCFKNMSDNELFDLESRPGKSSMNITTYIPKDKLPIFINNFNNTAHDITSLTHEFGHAFQLYSSQNLKYYENWWPTFDTCEIHSLTMELLTLPYMERFFGKDTNKFVYGVLYGILCSLCQAALVDEFQHLLYDEPAISIDERKIKWLELEKKYMPWVNYEESDYHKRGNAFQRISHIVHSPFYYIDYALAQTVALQFYLKSLKDSSKTWDEYIELCALGGSLSFVNIIKAIGLKTPFEKEILKEIAELIESNMKL